MRVIKDIHLNNKGKEAEGFTLHQFLAKHRLSFNSIQPYAEHVSVELLNERTIVRYFLENINTKDKDIMNGRMRLYLINERYKAFLTVIIYVFILYGQSYATTVSTI